MPIQNEKYSFIVSDSSGSPLTGATVELRKDATIYTCTEVGNGWYSIASIPTGKYSVFVDTVDTGETKAVGSGQVAALGNESDSVPVSDASEYSFQDPAELKTTLSLENVTNVAIPTPTGSDANKVIQVDSNGDYILGSSSVGGFETVFEVQTTSDLVAALAAEFDAKLLIITREDFNFVNAQTFEVWGSCSIIVANTFEPFQWQSNSVNVTFDYKAGADVALTSMQFLNGTIAFGSPADYTINIPWKVTNLVFIGSDTFRSVTGSNSFVYENALSAIPPSFTKPIAQDWWQNSAADKLDSVVAGTNVTIDNTDPLNPIINATGGGGSQDLDSVLTQGNTTGDNFIQFEPYSYSNASELKTPGKVFNLAGVGLALGSQARVYGQNSTGVNELFYFISNNTQNVMYVQIDENTDTFKFRIGGSSYPKLVFGGGVYDNLRLEGGVLESDYGTFIPHGKFEIESGKLTLGSTTNATPSNGDIWYSGTSINIQGDVTCNESNFLVEKTLGFGSSFNKAIRLGASNDASVNVGESYKWDFLVSGDENGQDLSFRKWVRGGGQQEVLKLDSDSNATFSGDVTCNIPTGTQVGLVGYDANGKLIQGTGGGGVTPGAWTNVTLASNISVRSGYRPLRYRSDGIDGVQVEGTCKYNTGFNLAPGFTVVLFTFASGSRPNNDFNVKAQVGYNGATTEIDAWAHIDASTGQVTLKNSDAIAISELYDISFNFRFSLT